MKLNAHKLALATVLSLGLAACSQPTAQSEAKEEANMPSELTIERPESGNRITVHGPSHITLHTEVTINAPAEVVWATLMAEDKDWSPSYSKFEGPMEEGATVKVTLRDYAGTNDGADQSYDFKWSYVEGRRMGWTGPSVTGGPVYDNHQFVVTPIDENTSLFVQSDDMTSTDPSVIDLSSEETLSFITSLVSDNYIKFNAALKAKAEENFAAQ